MAKPARVELVPFPVGLLWRVSVLGKVPDIGESGSVSEKQVERGDGVLATGSLLIALLSGIAGMILLVVACRLMGWFPDTLERPQRMGSLIVFALSLFCFFEGIVFTDSSHIPRFEINTMRAINRAEIRRANC